MDGYIFNLRRCLFRISPHSHFWNYTSAKCKRSVLIEMTLVFLLAASSNSLVDSFLYKYMSCLSLLLIESRMGKLILNHLIGNNYPEFFWTVTFSNWLEEVIIWNVVSGQSLGKPSWFSIYTKIALVLKSEL